MLDIFLSRPTWISPEFAPGLTNFLGLLETLDVRPRTLGTTDYPSKSPLDEVIALMDQCRGAIILGYPQIVASAGSVKATPIGEPLLLPTEWNHIEAGLAYARDLPLLLVHHRGVARGVFDRGALNNFLHEVDFADAAWPLSKTISGALKHWKTDVLQPRTATSSSPTEPRRRPALTQQHLQILVYIAIATPRRVEPESVARMLGAPQAKAQHVLDELEEAGFLDALWSAGPTVDYQLTPEGRAALVERGML